MTINTYRVSPRGFGGGGKSGSKQQRVAQEAPDTLRSRQFARILDIVSEGEIGGLVDGLKSVYLDETPVQNADGSYNFNGLTLFEAKGTQAQGVIPGFTETENEIAVGVEVTNALAVTRTISNANINAVRITAGFPALTSQNTSNGDLNGTSVSIAIDLQSNGGGFVEKINDTVSGKTTSKYQRSYRIELEGSAPWNIRFRRVSGDSAKSSVQDKTFFDSYTELIDSKIRYVNSALIGSLVDAEQFNSIPKRAFDLNLLLIKIPANYDPATRVYTGVWDGTFKVEWSDNPAWVFYELATNTRFGLGEYLDASTVDKWELYAIAQYCDELVSDGFGGQEPRFTCNVYLQNQAAAQKLMTQLASVFRGMAYWSGGQLTCVQDRPQDPYYLFTQANVIDGKFSYSGSALKARKTVALVTWQDPADFYRPKVEYVQNDGLVARFGVNSIPVTAIGCTSRGQATRFGNWILETESSNAETLNFSTGLEGARKGLTPGRVVKIHDPQRAGKRFGGRVVSGTINSITIDSPVTIEVGKTYTLNLTLPDGTTEEKSVSNAPGSTSVLTTADFSQAPTDSATWVLSANDLNPQTFRILSVKESRDAVYEITAIKYDPNKFAKVEQNLILEPLQISSIPATLPTAQNIKVEEFVVNYHGELKTVMAISFDAVPNAEKYQAKWRPLNGNFQNLPESTATQFDVFDVAPGQVFVEIVAVSPIGKVSAPGRASGTMLGRAGIKVLPQVQGLELKGQGNKTEFVGKDAEFTWFESSMTENHEMGQEPFGGNTGSLDPTFKDYEVRIYDKHPGAGGILLRNPDQVTQPNYKYDFQKNVEDSGALGPRRTFAIGVVQRSVINQVSPKEAVIVVSNPAPSLQSAVVTATFDTIFINYTPPADPDFVGMRVWMDTQSGFDLEDDKIVWTGSDIPAVIGALNADTTYYLRYAFYDAFGKTGLAVSAEVSIKTGFVGGDQIAQQNLTPAGAQVELIGPIVQEGWVLADGNTIGNAESGASNRANDDTQNLFELLWNNKTQGEAPVCDGIHIVTAVGNVEIDTDQSKFGGASALFDDSGPNTYLSLPESPDWHFGASEAFTIDLWFKLKTGISNLMRPRFYVYSNSGSEVMFLGFKTAGISTVSGFPEDIQFGLVGGNGADVVSEKTFVPALNTQYHLAIVRDTAAELLRIFINGNSIGTESFPNTSGIPVSWSSDLLIGGWSGNSLQGWIDEYRISDIARWTSNFTPPSSAYTTDANTKLLLHMDGSDGSTDFNDGGATCARGASAEADFNANKTIKLPTKVDHIIKL